MALKKKSRKANTIKKKKPVIKKSVYKFPDLEKKYTQNDLLQILGSIKNQGTAASSSSSGGGGMGPPGAQGQKGGRGERGMRGRQEPLPPTYSSQTVLPVPDLSTWQNVNPLMDSNPSPFIYEPAVQMDGIREINNTQSSPSPPRTPPQDLNQINASIQPMIDTQPESSSQPSINTNVLSSNSFMDVSILGPRRQREEEEDEVQEQEGRMVQARRISPNFPSIDQGEPILRLISNPVIPRDIITSGRLQGGGSIVPMQASNELVNYNNNINPVPQLPPLPALPPTENSNVPALPPSETPSNFPLLKFEAEQEDDDL